MSRDSRVVAALLCLLLAGAAPAQAASPSECLPGRGSTVEVGPENAHLTATFHLSLLANLGGRGSFGVETSGVALGMRVFDFDVAIVAEGSLLSNPVEALGVAFEASFLVPAAGGGSVDAGDVDGVQRASCAE